MKPFDLEAAQRGEPIVTSFGIEMIYVGIRPHSESPVVASTKDGIIYAYSVDGVANRDMPPLFMAPKKRILWVNVYLNLPFSHLYETLGLANDNAMSGRIGGKAWPLEIEE